MIKASYKVYKKTSKMKTIRWRNTRFFRPTNFALPKRKNSKSATSQSNR